MNEHTTAFNNFHTQLLLQMQTNSNIQDLKDQLRSIQSELNSTKEELAVKKVELEISKANQATTQKELDTTKAALATTQNDLQTTRLKLEQTMEQLKATQKNAKTMEHQLKIQQENVEKGFMLNHQTTETFATFYLQQQQHQQHQHQNLTPETIFESLNTKQPIKPIEPFEINGKKLGFPIINEFVQNLNNSFQEGKYNLLLNKMEAGTIYYIDNKQLIFKLHLPYNYRKLRIRHSDIIASLATKYPDKVVVKNNQLVLLDWNNYEIYLQIPNYSNGNSKCFLYHKNENGENLLFGYGWNHDINIDDYKSTSNEYLFHIIMN